MIQCPECRSMIPDDSAFCDQCGKELKWCPECKKPKRGTECPVCGSDLVPGRKYMASSPSPSGEAAAPDPVRGSAAHPSQPCGWAPPSNVAEGGTPPGGDTLLEGQQEIVSKASSRINVAEVPEGLPQAEILVDCSKGTYIRALARDLGEALGSGAFLHSLRRTKNGGFSVEEALSIEDISSIFR